MKNRRTIGKIIIITFLSALAFTHPNNHLLTWYWEHGILTVNGEGSIWLAGTVVFVLVATPLAVWEMTKKGRGTNG